MDEGFDREFYRCRWRLALPVGRTASSPTYAPRAAQARALRVRSCAASWPFSRGDAKAGQSFRPWGAIGAGVREGRGCR